MKRQPGIPPKGEAGEAILGHEWLWPTAQQGGCSGLCLVREGSGLGLPLPNTGRRDPPPTKPRKRWLAGGIVQHRSEPITSHACHLWMAQSP